MNIELNTKLFSINGALSRRDFFLNILIITILTSPCWWIAEIFIQNSTSISTIIVNAILILLDFALLIPTIIKRINDISGKENKKSNCICLLIFAISFFLGLFIGLTPFIVIFCYLYLQIKKGKVSSKLPHDILNEFNWGAFFGTWIWGIINKSYKTLWSIILWFTPVGLLFNIVCGLKGNKWAAKNRDWNSIEEFKKSQDKQTIFFVILNIIILPIISIVLLIGTIVCLINIEKHHPGNMDKILIKVEKLSDIITNSEFESYEIGSLENKYYINPQKWKNKSRSERRDIFKYATSITVFKKNLKRDSRTSDKKELVITKIYNSKNGELLGEYIEVDPEKLKNSDSLIRDTFIEVVNAYKFYEPTK